MHFSQIKQRTLKQLAAVYPKLEIKPNIKKSNLRSLYRAIDCQSIKSNEIRQLSQIKKEQLSTIGKNILKKIQQILTTYINLLEHNEKIRQHYEITIMNSQTKNDSQFKNIKQIYQETQNINSKSQLLQFISKRGQQDLFNSSNMGDGDKNNQWKQIYILGSTNAYTNVDRIDQDQYLVYHEDVLQKLLVFVNMINKEIHKLENPQGSPTLNQLVRLLSSDELFRTNNNKFTQLINFILLYVTQNSNKIEKKRKQLTYYKKELQQAILRNYYMQFMSRKQILTVSQYLKDSISFNKELLKDLRSKSKLNEENSSKELFQKVHKQKKDIRVLKNKMKEISDYLCDKEEKIFPNFYQRNIKKVMISMSNAWNVVSSAMKLNRRVLQKLQKNILVKNDSKRFSQQKMMRMSKQSKQSKKSVNKQVKKTLEEKVQEFVQKFEFIQHDLQQKQFTINNQQFQQFFDKIQELQIKLNELITQSTQQKITKQKQNQTDNQQQNHQNNKVLLSKLQENLLQYQKKLIQNSKKNLNLKQKLSPTKIMTKQINRASQMSKASTVFNDFPIDQNEIFLRLPQPQIDKMKSQKIKFEDFIKLSEQILNNFNPKNAQILQDLKFVDLGKLQYCLWQGQNNTQMIKQVQLKPLIKEQPKQVSPQKPQKSPKKQQKPIKKPQPKSSNKKQPPQPSIQQIQKQKQFQRQTIIKDILSKLKIIKSLILPQISQSLIPKIFYGNVHTNLFIKFYEKLTLYKKKLQGLIIDQKLKSNFELFYKNRLNYLNIILKNMPQFIQILKFTRQLSENKLKLDPIQEQTYNFILKAILATKQIQAYMMENQDLLGYKYNEKISKKAIELVQQNIYKPFMAVFKEIFKIQAKKDLIRELVEMMDFCKNVSTLYQNMKIIVQNTAQQNFDKQAMFKQLNVIRVKLSQKLKQQGSQYKILRIQKVTKFSKNIQKLVQFLSSKSKNQDKVRKYSKQLLQEFI